VSVALILAVIAVAPLGARLLLGQTGLTAGEAQMPAIVQAAGTEDPNLRTLVLTAEDQYAVRAELVVGPGVRLDDVRTADFRPEATEQDEWIAQIVGDLSSTGRGDALQQDLAEHGIGFVLLSGEGEGSQRAQLQAAIDE